MVGWTAPTNGLVTLDASGSSFETLLAVYTGITISNLTVVANDDGYGTSATLLANGQFQLSVARGISGQGYRILSSANLVNWTTSHERCNYKLAIHVQLSGGELSQRVRGRTPGGPVPNGRRSVDDVPLLVRRVAAETCDVATVEISTAGQSSDDGLCCSFGSM